MTYISLEDLKVQLDIPADSDQFDADLTRALNAANEDVEGFCRRRFDVDSTAVERTYDLDGSEIIEIDDLSDGDTATVTVNDDELVVTDDYSFLPLNSALDGKPYTHVRLVNPRAGTLVVEGKFGWPDVPARVIEATGLLAGRYFKRREAPLGLVAFGDAQAMRLLITDPDVARLLERLQRGAGGKGVQSVRLG